MKQFSVMICFFMLATIACTLQKPLTAKAIINSANGSDVSGEVLFQQKGREVHIMVKVRGLSPGPHGFHIHEVGDCSTPDASSAGGHFNPTSMPHGGPGDAVEHHAGDLGNIIAENTGNTEFQISSQVLSLKKGTSSIIGRAVVIHADPDDLTSQPAGASGARIGCGVIQ